MAQQHDPLRQLIADTCKHPQGSIERQRGLNKIVRAIAQSGKLWQEHTPYYEDALQQMWLYFSRNLCEATTSKKPYDSTRSSVITWLDRYLRKRLEDFYLESQHEVSTKAPESSVQFLEASINMPSLEEEVREWVETDADGELRSTYIKGHPEVNCQMLILRRLPPRTEWKTLSEEFNLSISTLNAFYRRQCFPRLRKFGEKHGYLE